MLSRKASRGSKELGATIVEVELPNAAAAISAYYVLGPCEAFSNLSRFDSVRYGHHAHGKNLEQRYEDSRAQGFGPEAKRRIMLGAWLLASGVYDEYYIPAQKVRTLITADYTKAFEKVDAIVLPTSPRTAFKFGEVSDPASMYLSDIYTISINIAGNGGMSLPLHSARIPACPSVCKSWARSSMTRSSCAWVLHLRLRPSFPASRRSRREVSHEGTD